MKVSEMIVEALRDGPATAGEIAAHASIPTREACARLIRMLRAGVVKRCGVFAKYQRGKGRKIVSMWTMKGATP